MNLITGATGHLGNVLARELLASGKRVRALALPGEDRSHLAGLEIEWLEGNILDETALEAACTGIKTVYHMAALVSIEEGKEDLLYRVNVEGTKNVVRAALRAGVKRLVYTSSIHALARPPEGVWISEEMPFDGQNPAGPYDRTKAEASLAVLEAGKEGLDVVVVCPTGVIGPYDYRRSEIGELFLSWMRPRLHFLIDGRFDFVDVRDVARGHILAAEKGRAGQVYILGSERIQIDRLRELVQVAAGRSSPAIIIPRPLALFICHFTMLYYRLARSRPRLTRYSIETLAGNSFISSEKANRELGYRARALSSSVVDTVRWWLDHRQEVRPTLRVSAI
ncbi:MAG: SDR family oxidoreductase [Anaerolineaceae bacterium]|nr:SDR family oxidoreductase [Anaerolineaceae bacterium]